MSLLPPCSPTASTLTTSLSTQIYPDHNNQLPNTDPATPFLTNSAQRSATLRASPPPLHHHVVPPAISDSDSHSPSTAAPRLAYGSSAPRPAPLVLAHASTAGSATRVVLARFAACVTRTRTRHGPRLRDSRSARPLRRSRHPTPTTSPHPPTLQLPPLAVTGGRTHFGPRLRCSRSARLLRRLERHSDSTTGVPPNVSVRPDERRNVCGSVCAPPPPLSSL